MKKFLEAFERDLPILIAFSFLIAMFGYPFFREMSKSPEEKAAKEARYRANRQAAQLNQLNRDLPSGLQFEGVVYQEPRPIGESGVSLLVVERLDDGNLFNVIVSSSAKLKKGDSIKYEQLFYLLSSTSGDYINVLR